MILVDPPADYGPGREGYSHLLSDLPGEAGSRELAAFAAAAGLRGKAHGAGTHREHHDVRGQARARCVGLGAREVTKRQLGEAVRRKRAAAETGARERGRLTDESGAGGRQMEVDVDQAS